GPPDPREPPMLRWRYPAPANDPPERGEELTVSPAGRPRYRASRPPAPLQGRRRTAVAPRDSPPRPHDERGRFLSWRTTAMERIWTTELAAHVGERVLLKGW